MLSLCRVKLPKTFLAVNLSDAFSFQEKQNGESQETTQQGESQEETTQNGESDVLEMKDLGRGVGTTTTTTTTTSDEPAPSARQADGSGEQPETDHVDRTKEVEAAEQLI